MQIQIIIKEEYPSVSALVVQVFRENVADSMDEPGKQVFENFASTEQMQARDQAGAYTLVAKLDGEIVGMLQVRSPGHVCLFFVSTKQHGKGIGHALMQAARMQSEVRTVNSSVNAVKSYTRYGFVPNGDEQVQNGIRFVPMVRTNK